MTKLNSPPAVTKTHLRALTLGDTAAVLALNNACVPAVSSLDTEGFVSLLAECAAMLGLFRNEQLIGLLFLGREGMKYNSANYAWVSKRYTEFWYVDRIAIDEPHRSSGFGPVLYAEAFKLAKNDGLPLLAEINSAPPNPRSLAYHKRLGFEVVGALTHRPGYAVDFVCWRAEEEA